MYEIVLDIANKFENADVRWLVTGLEDPYNDVNANKNQTTKEIPLFIMPNNPNNTPCIQRLKMQGTHRLSAYTQRT